VRRRRPALLRGQLVQRRQSLRGRLLHPLRRIVAGVLSHEWLQQRRLLRGQRVHRRQQRLRQPARRHLHGRLLRWRQLRKLRPDLLRRQHLHHAVDRL
jgi:hypothetical protein